MPQKKYTPTQKVWTEDFLNLTIVKNFIWLWLPFYAVWFGIRSLMTFLVIGKGISEKTKSPKK